MEFWDQGYKPDVVSTIGLDIGLVCGYMSRCLKWQTFGGYLIIQEGIMKHVYFKISNKSCTE